MSAPARGVGVRIEAMCPICDRLRRAAGGGEPLFLADLGETVAVLHEHQAYPGWCVLWLKEHVEHLAELPFERQQRVWGEVARVAAAVRRAFDPPPRINYECLGNVVAHVHWHVIPRHADDPSPRSTVWTRPTEELHSGVSAERRAELIERLRTAGLR